MTKNPLGWVLDRAPLYAGMTVLGVATVGTLIPLFPKVKMFPLLLGLILVVLAFVTSQVSTYLAEENTDRLLGEVEDSVVFLSKELRDHGYKLREINDRTKGIAAHQAQGTLQGAVAGAETGRLGIGANPAGQPIPRGFGGQESSTAYPHRLERDYTDALRRHYDARLRPADEEVAYEDSYQTATPQTSMGDQTNGNSGLAIGEFNRLMAQSPNEVGYNSNMAQSLPNTWGSLLGVRDAGYAPVDVAVNQSGGRTSVRPVQEEGL